MFKLGTIGGAEYAITGGFFVATQLAILVLLYPDFCATEAKALSGIVAQQVGDLPLEVRPALVSLFIALSLLSVFFFGLLLDLIGSVFVVRELQWFLRNVQRNKDWLRELVADEFQRYIGDDFNNVLAREDVHKRFLDRLKFWRTSFWGFDKLGDFRLLGASQRLQLTFVSYVLGSEHKARVELLDKRMKLYEISRSITTTLVLVSVQFLVSFSLQRSILFYAAVWALTGLSLFITYRSYSRVSDALFTLVYMQMKLDEEAEKPDEPSISAAYSVET
jgi:hypothetical protein